MRREDYERIRDAQGQEAADKAKADWWASLPEEDVDPLTVGDPWPLASDLVQ